MNYFVSFKSLTTAIIYICAIFVFCDLPSQSGNEPVPEPFPKEKCESLMVNCSCYDYEVVAGIVCNGRNDFTNFSYYLATGAIFEKNTTYEITLTDTDCLPSNLLDGLIVYRLILDTPNISIFDKSIFYGVYRLRRFHVRRSGIQEVPDFHIIRDSIRTINIDNSRLPFLKGSHLQDLPLVERLTFINNHIRYIDPSAFKGTDYVKIFDVSNNLLEFLPPNLLDNWKNLNKFAVSNNRLLHVDQLFKLTHPRIIYLDYNNLTDIDSILHYNMTSVETLLLANNPLRQITMTSFNSKIPNVRFLYLDSCLLRDFDPDHYRKLSQLATLDLNYNLIEEIGNKTISFGVGLELSFIGNRIKKFEGQISFEVKRLYLNENKLESLGRTLQYTQTVEVSVARNMLQFLSQEDFRGVHGTANLELQVNKIRRIDRYTFRNIVNNLHYLDLSSNLIPSLNGSVKYLSQLKSLNLTDNLIQTFEEGEFTGMNELSELYLQRNQIIELSVQLKELAQLQYLVISNNNIETLSADNIPKKLRYLYLADNPLNCDCKFLPFLLWLNSSDFPVTDIPLCPPITAEDGHLSTATCPERCTCSCAEDESDYFMSLDCSSRNISVVPSFLTANFVQNEEAFDFRRPLTFDQSTNKYFHIRDKVLSVDLENNSLKSLDSAVFPASLLHLYLSSNELTKLPESMLYTLPKLRRISLSENPWECDCDRIDFKKWMLSKIDIIQDVNATRCRAEENSESALDGRIIWTLTDLDLCPPNIALYTSVTFGLLVFLLLCLGTKIAYTKYEHYVKVFLHSRGINCVKVKDYEKPYDAFISYSDKDSLLVIQELIPGIQRKDPNIKLCFSDQDFLAGCSIVQNIINAVQNSKNTVIVLSRNFLVSQWCRKEFEVADFQANKDKMHRVIVIKVGDLPEIKDTLIQVYLHSTIYLTWGEKDFLNKLLCALQTSRTVTNTKSQNRVI